MRTHSDFLAAYREYTEGSEAPEKFHTWVGVGMLGAALGRNVWIEFGHFQVVPNFFIVLVSSPGRSRKGTALRIGYGLLSTVAGISTDETVHSYQSLIAKLMRTPHLAVLAAELSSLLTDPRSRDFLADVLDGHSYQVETVARGVEKIESPSLSIFGATTPMWLEENVQWLVDSGLESRMIQVHSTERRPVVVFPELTKLQQNLRISLIRDLQHINKLAGEVTLDSAARRWYEEWYSTTTPAREAPFGLRLPTHLMKVATVLSVSEGDSLTIYTSHLEAAWTLLQGVGG